MLNGRANFHVPPTATIAQVTPLESPADQPLSPLPPLEGAWRSNYHTSSSDGSARRSGSNGRLSGKDDVVLIGVGGATPTSTTIVAPSHATGHAGAELSSSGAPPSNKTVTATNSILNMNRSHSATTGSGVAPPRPSPLLTPGRASKRNPSSENGSHHYPYVSVVGEDFGHTVAQQQQQSATHTHGANTNYNVMNIITSRSDMAAFRSASSVIGGGVGGGGGVAAFGQMMVSPRSPSRQPQQHQQPVVVGGGSTRGRSNVAQLYSISKLASSSRLDGLSPTNQANSHINSTMFKQQTTMSQSFGAFGGVGKNNNKDNKDNITNPKDTNNITILGNNTFALNNNTFANNTYTNNNSIMMTPMSQKQGDLGTVRTDRSKITDRSKMTGLTGKTSGKTSATIDLVRQAALKGSKSRFTLPLSLVLFLQCSLVIVAFVAIVIAADTVANSTATVLIRRNVQTELKYAATEIDGPISAIEQSLLEFRNRYISYFNMAGRVEPCSQTVDGFTASGGFYADSIQAINANPLLASTFYVRMTPRIDPTTGRNVLNQCSASNLAIFKRLNNVSRRSLRPPSLSDFEDLDGRLPLSPNAVTRLESQIEASLKVRILTWFPLSVLDDTGSYYVLMLIAAAPVRYNITNNITGEEESIVFYNMNATRLTDQYLAANRHLYLRPISVLSMTIRMSNYPKIVRAITPENAGAHTSIYDLTRGTLIATTVFSDRDQLDSATGMLYPAGIGPSDALNEAFAVANPYSLAEGEERILFGDERVVSAYLYSTNASGIRFAVVQSTPRDHYFGPMKTLRKIMIVVGIVSAVSIVAACLLVGISIAIGGHAIILNMGLAAAMKMDRTIRITSLLREVQQLADGFDAMNDKLLEARAYLPQHMLMTSSDESGEDEDGGNKDDDEEEGDAEIGSQAKSHASRRTGASAGRHSNSLRQQPSEQMIMLRSNNNNNNSSGTPMNSTTNGGGVSSAQQQQQLIANPTSVGGIAIKRVTVLSVNARGFHNIVNVMSPATITGPTTIFTELVSESATLHRGVIDSFHGDHFVLTFNVARNNAEGPAKAARCALEIAANGYAREGKVFAMGISTGRACVGNLGTNTLKKLSVIGPVFSRAICLERLCRRFNNPSARSTAAGGGAAGGGFGFGGVGVNWLEPRGGGADSFAANSGSNSLGVGSTIECLIDGLMYSEVQHSFSVYAIGALFGGPFTTIRKHDSTEVVAKHVGLPTMLQVHPTAGGGRVHRTPSPAQHIASPPLEFVYALRKASASNKGDEWLYELSNSNTSTRAGEVSALVVEYLMDVYNASKDDNVAGLAYGFAPPPPQAHHASRPPPIVDGGLHLPPAAVSLMRAGSNDRADSPRLGASIDEASSDTQSAVVTRNNNNNMNTHANYFVPNKDNPSTAAAGEAFVVASLRFEALVKLAQGLLKLKSEAESVIAATGINTVDEDPLFWEALKYGLALCAHSSTAGNLADQQGSNGAGSILPADLMYPMPSSASSQNNNNNANSNFYNNDSSGTRESSAISSGIGSSRRLSLSAAAGAQNQGGLNFNNNNNVILTSYNVFAQLEAVASIARITPPGFYTPV